MELGESVAVNGVCLTVTERAMGSFVAEIMPETLKRTNFAQLRQGTCVNLERALRVQDRLNGHIVQGHVDAVGKVTAIDKEGNATILQVSFPREYLKYTAIKGSIAIDGISLTIVQRNIEQSFVTVSIAPYTLNNTIIRYYSVGSTVNIEFDILAKYVESMLKHTRFGVEEDKQGLSAELLFQYGFMG